MQQNTLLLPNQVPQQVVKLPAKQNREVRLYIPAKTNGWNLKITLPNLYFGVPCEFSGA